MFPRTPSFRLHRSSDFRARRRAHHCRFQLERLDERILLSATPLPDVGVPSPGYSEPFLSISRLGGMESQPAGTTSPTGYTPSQIRAAYGFSQMNLTGTGETIAIVNAYNDPDIAGDLHQFDVHFGLSDPPSFKVVGQTGGAPPTATDPTGGWEAEEALDVEWAHVIAPAANMVLVEANSSANSDLYTAVVTAASSQFGASVVSISWGRSEFSARRNTTRISSRPASRSWPHRVIAERWCTRRLPRMSSGLAALL